MADQASEKPNPGPPDPDAGLRQKTAEKLRQRIDVRINNKDLKSALDELAEAHGFEYRFDPETLEQTGVKPEQAQVRLNVRRQPLVGVLREILQGHGLHFGLDGAVVVIVAPPKLPKGMLWKKKARASDPIERIVRGNVLASHDQKQATAETLSPLDEERQALLRELNTEHLEREHARQVAVCRQMFEGRLTDEVASCFRLVELTVEQKQEIRRAAQQAFNEFLVQWADRFVFTLLASADDENGGIAAAEARGDLPGAQPHLEDVRDEVQQAILRVLKDSGLPERATLYERESTLRNAQRKRATIRNLVSAMDQQVNLSIQQSKELETLLTREWQPSWVRALELMPEDKILVFPNLSAGSVEKLLTEQQWNIWQGKQRFDPENLVGYGFRFSRFFKPQETLEEVEAAAAGGEVSVDMPQPAVPAGNAVPTVNEPVEINPEEK